MESGELGGYRRVIQLELLAWNKAERLLAPRGSQTELRTGGAGLECAGSLCGLVELPGSWDLVNPTGHHGRVAPLSDTKTISEMLLGLNMGDLTQTQRRKLPTKAEIAAEDLNEWGYPCNSKYAFRGFVAGAARWERIA